MSTRTIVATVLALQDKPYSTQTLAGHVGMSPEGAKLLMRRLRDDGFIEFKRWGERNGGAAPALYGWKGKT